MKKLTISLLAAFAVAGTSFAGTTVTSKEYKQPVVVPCFKDQEFQVDLFYSYNDACHQGDRVNTDSFSGTDAIGPFTAVGTLSRQQYFRDGSGGGLGFSYYFMRYFGVGVEGNWWQGVNAGGTGTLAVTRAGVTTITTFSDAKHDTAQQFTGNVLIRYPFEGSICWAPYILGGGGGVWDGKSTGFGDVGVGAEYRVTPMIGLFTDWRWEFMCNRNDVNMTRAGIRFAF